MARLFRNASTFRVSLYTDTPNSSMPQTQQMMTQNMQQPLMQTGMHAQSMAGPSSGGQMGMMSQQPVGMGHMGGGGMMGVPQQQQSNMMMAPGAVGVPMMGRSPRCDRLVQFSWEDIWHCKHLGSRMVQFICLAELTFWD